MTLSTTGGLDAVIEEVLANRNAQLAAAKKITDRAIAEGRDLRASEQREHGRLIKSIGEYDERIGELQEQREMAARSAAEMRKLDYGRGARVIAEPHVYDAGSAAEGTSFLRDLWMAKRGDAGAGERLARHAREAELEYRDVGTGAFAGLTVPAYLTDLVARAARAGRPTADICTKHPLPPEGMTASISRITTGSGVAVQASENAAVTETNMDDTLLSANVATYPGMQDVSRQAVERGTGIDEIVVADLARAYHTAVDSAILNADGSGGTHLGIRSTSGIVSVSYTDASPTAAELYPKLFDLVQQIQSGVFMGVSHLIMHPRRWWWLASQVGTSFPFLQLANAPQGAAGQVLGTGTYEKGLAGVLSTVGVIVDANIPTNLGGGTNEDVILGVTADELHLWETPDPVLFIRSDEALSSNLTVRFVAYGYSAFTAGRYPGAHGTIGGTGLVTPTFA
jgi:HK97 family phage major capsid protein